MSGGLPGGPDAPDAADRRPAGDPGDPGRAGNTGRAGDLGVAGAPTAEPFTLEPAPPASGADDPRPSATADARPVPAWTPPPAPTPSGTTALGVVRDNLEAIAFALILALLLRHLVVEVFKIPTGSMEPTLFGDNSTTRPGTPGDRILVQKDAYLFSAPARWDVVVFHYPLFWPKAFIKRLVFLPNEAGRIERGDPWVGNGRAEGEPAFHPARKPAGVRDQLYLPVYPPVGRPAESAPDVFWRTTGAGPGALDAEAHGRLVYRGDGPDAARFPEPARRAYGYAIRDVDRAGFRDPGTEHSDSFLCPDIRVRCRVTTTGPAEVELAWQPGDGRKHVLLVATEGRGPSRAAAAGTQRLLAARLVPGTPVDLALESVDGDLRAWVNGDEVAVLADELSLEETIRLEGLSTGAPPQLLTLGARGAPTTIDAVRIDHDLYYTNYHRDGSAWPFRGDFMRLGPDDHYMLGDNTRSSSDSRKWQATGVRLADGRHLVWDSRPDDDIGYQPRDTTVGDRVRREVFDVEGVRRRWFRDEEEGGTEPVRLPFVKRDRIIGRAWFGLVFWPLREILPRVRFVR